MAQKVDPKTIKPPKDIVAQDRNWTLRVNNELEAQQKWNNQWGYYAKGISISMSGFSPQKSQPIKKQTINDRIADLQHQIQQLDGNVFQTTSSAYGKGNNVQIFIDPSKHIVKSNDLRALQRRLPKGWKKPKWTPPVDPFDPLSKLNKKK